MKESRASRVIKGWEVLGQRHGQGGLCGRLPREAQGGEQASTPGAKLSGLRAQQAPQSQAGDSKKTACHGRAGGVRGKPETAPQGSLSSSLMGTQVLQGEPERAPRSPPMGKQPESCGVTGLPGHRPRCALWFETRCRRALSQLVLPGT